MAIPPLRRNAWALDAAEWTVAGLFLLFFLLSLGAVLGSRPGASTPLLLSLSYSALWAGWLVLLQRRLPPHRGHWHLLRGLMPYLALALQYNLMRDLVPAAHPATYDASLADLSHRVGGSLGAAFWSRVSNGALTEIFSAAYLTLFAWLLGLMVFLLSARRALYPRFLTGLALVYGAGFLGYLLYPALGPRYAFPEEWAWLDGGPLTRLADSVVALLGARFDVFPSLHAALSSYLCVWQVRHDRRGILWALPLTALIWVSTLGLGFHYLPDLVSGGLVAWGAVWAAPRLERAYAHLRAGWEPPVLWLEDLVEGEGARWGRLAGRLSEFLPLAGRTAPGLLIPGPPRTRGGDILRGALDDLGGGPFWLRPSDASAPPGRALTALKPLSREQAIRTVLTDRKKRSFVVQAALKVTALGLTRSMPPRGPGSHDVELRLTSLPLGRVSIHRLKPGGGPGGLTENPGDYYPEDFPVRGWELFEVVQLARRLSARWGSLTEVEWVLSEGRVYVLDVRPVRWGTPAS
jgi:hypothetical protein